MRCVLRGNWEYGGGEEIVRHHCMWCGRCGEPSCVQIYELVREKYTGRNIIRHGSTFSSGRDRDNDNARRVSSLSNSSYSMAEVHRRAPQTEAVPSPAGKASSSTLREGSSELTPQPPTALREAAESLPEESAHRKTSYDVAHTSSDCDDEVFVPLCNMSETRRPSILKLLPSERSPGENKRGQHHVQFTESQPPT